MIKITSKENKLIKEIIKLKQKKFRIMSDKFIIEGEKFVKEIPDDWVVDKIIVSEKFFVSKSQTFDFSSFDSSVVSGDLFEYVSDTDSPQGIMAVCYKKKYVLRDLDFNDFNSDMLVVAAENLNDPGNLGTLIRSCAAFGVDALLLSKNSVDVYNPKVLRACAGNIFKIKIIEDLDFKLELNRMKKHGFKMFSTSGCCVDKKIFDLQDISFKQRLIIIFGNEASGVSEGVLELSDKLIKIQMHNSVESLNVSVAASIVLYEAYLQRKRRII